MACLCIDLIIAVACLQVCHSTYVKSFILFFVLLYDSSFDCQDKPDLIGSSYISCLFYKELSLNWPSLPVTASVDWDQPIFPGSIHQSSCLFFFLCSTTNMNLNIPTFFMKCLILVDFSIFVVPPFGMLRLRFRIMHLQWLVSRRNLKLSCSLSLHWCLAFFSPIIHRHVSIWLIFRSLHVPLRLG